MRYVHWRVILRVLLIPLILVATLLTVLTFVLYLSAAPEDALFTLSSACVSWLLSAFAWANRPQRDLQDSDAPLRPTSPGQIHASRIPWVERPIPTVQRWTTSRRVFIQGVRDMGKTRALAILLQRAVDAEKIAPDRIFELTPALLRLDDATLKRRLADICLLKSHMAVVIPDLPRYFQGKQLDKLAGLFAAVTACGNVMYVVADGRTNELTPQHDAWLADNAFDLFDLTPLSDEPLRRLVISATAAGAPLAATLEEGVIELLLAHSDGTPESVLAPLRLLSEQGHTHVTVAEARNAAQQSTASIWRETIEYLSPINPAIPFLVAALAAFHAARLTPYAALVNAFALHSWRAVERRSRTSQKQIDAAWRLLGNFEVSIAHGRVLYLHAMAEARLETTGPAPVAELRAFLRQYRSPRRIKRLRVVTAGREQQVAVLLDLAQWYVDQDDTDTALAYGDAALEVAPNRQAYLLRAGIYQRQGALEFAIADYS